MQPGLVSYGLSQFSGRVETVQVEFDNSFVRETLSTPGNGRVLVVDGGGLVVALVGDKLAKLGVENGWVGIVVNGYVRDTAVLATLPFGVMAFGTHPARSFREATGRTVGAGRSLGRQDRTR